MARLVYGCEDLNDSDINDDMQIDYNELEYFNGYQSCEIPVFRRFTRSRFYM